MYTKFYSLLERPFELTPDPRYLYLSAHHREALAHLTYGVEERKGFVQLTGEVGTGKTTMLDALVRGLDAATKVARLSHTTIDETDVVRLLAGEFGVDPVGGSKAELLRGIGDRLKKWTAEGRNAVFVVDEAQNLSLAVLEEIRLLSNMRANGRCSLQIILCGQPELRENLQHTELRQLRQRISIRYHLRPLSREETRDYVAHRLAVAGGKGRIFDRGAVDAVYEHSGGVPRLVNALCDRALLAGYAQNRRRITRALVLEAAEAVEGWRWRPSEQAARPEGPGEVSVRTRRRRRWVVPALAALAVVVAVGVYSWSGAWRQAALGSPEADVAEDPSAESVGGAVVNLVPPVFGEGDDVLFGSSRLRAGGEERGPDGAKTPPAPEGDEPPPESERVAVEPRPPEGTPASESDPVADRPVVEAEPAHESLPAVEQEERPLAREDGSYWVVVISGKDEDAAWNETALLWDKGLAAEVQRIELPGRGVWFRVVVGEGHPSMEAARGLLDVLRGIGYEGAWIAKR